MEIEKKGIGSDMGKNSASNGKNVNSIIKQLEAGHTFRAKPPPVPPVKPSSSSSTNGIASSSNLETNNKLTKTLQAENDDDEREFGVNQQNRLINGNHQSSNDVLSRSAAPFRYVSPDAISKISTIKEKKLPPTPPPKPNFGNGGTDEKKIPPKKLSWLKVDDHWVPSPESSESRLSTTSMSSSENEDKLSSSNEQEAACVADGTDSVSTRSSTFNDAESIDFQPLSSPGFKKPLVPKRNYERGSTDRPLPPVPSTKPPILRKLNPSTNSMLSNSSAPSLSDENDSDGENGTSNQRPDTEERSSTNESAPVVVITPTLTRAEKAKRCAEEFLVTEKSYVKTLEDLSENFLNYMQELPNRPFVEPDIPTIIAKSLQELRGIHRILADEFQERLDNWESDPRLADILLHKGPFLKMSIRFLQQKESLATQVLMASRKYPEFHTALTAFEKTHFEGLHLVHKLDSVHQRLCRYPLLLSSYLKYLSPDSEEYLMAEKAKESINLITLELEKSLAQEDGTRKLSELYRRIVQGGFEVIEPGRKLLKEGPILKYSRKERQNRHLILFTDVLICCSPVVTGSMLRVRHIFRLRDPATNVRVRGESGDSDTSGWEFIVKGRQKSIIFVAEHEMEGKAWVKEIQKAMSGAQRISGEFVNPRISGLREPEDLPITPPTEPETPPPYGNGLAGVLGQFAPVWTPDQRVTMCQCCGLAFSPLFRRRHHCRACGHVICDDCSGRAPLEYLDFKADRVCPRCYAVLYEQTKDKNFLERVTERMQGTDPFLCLFAAPKNRYRSSTDVGFEIRPGVSDANEEEEESVLIKGYLKLSRNRQQQWKRYWTVVREFGLMEFYKAVDDRTSEIKIVLLGWQAKAVDANEFIFQLSHTNQFEAAAGSNGDSNMHYFLKAEDGEAMERWLSALEDFFQKFIS